MPKLFTPNHHDTRKRISIRMPKEMHKEIINVLAGQGIGINNLSTWVSSAISNLEKKNNYCDIISEEWLDPYNNVSRPITLDEDAEKSLRKMNAMFRCKYQSSPRVNSKIIRTAITQQLIEEGLL